MTIWSLLSFAALALVQQSQAAVVPKTLTVGLAPWAIVTTDVNDDGLVDVVTSNYGAGTVSVLTGKTASTLTFNTKKDYSVGLKPSAVVSADVDGDASVDLVVANQGASTLSILLNKGDGTFQAKKTVSNVGQVPTALAVGDINVDGILDVVVASGVGATVNVLLGKGNATFQTKKAYTVKQTPVAVVLADISEDDNLDIITANAASSTVSLLFGAGDGTFGTAKSLSVPTPVSVTVADVDADGIFDIITASLTGKAVSVFTGKGEGTFNTRKNYPVPGAPRSVVAADVDGDGFVDLVTANFGTRSVSILSGNGDGTFNTAFGYQVGLQPIAVAVAQINPNGLQQILTANSGATTVSLLTPVFPPTNVDVKVTFRLRFGTGKACADDEGKATITAALEQELVSRIEEATVEVKSQTCVIVSATRINAFSLVLNVPNKAATLTKLVTFLANLRSNTIDLIDTGRVTLVTYTCASCTTAVSSSVRAAGSTLSASDVLNFVAGEEAN